jgi:hypothetical protein
MLGLGLGLEWMPLHGSTMHMGYIVLTDGFIQKKVTDVTEEQSIASQSYSSHEMRVIMMRKTICIGSVYVIVFYKVSE